MALETRSLFNKMAVAVTLKDQSIELKVQCIPMNCPQGSFWTLQAMLIITILHLGNRNLQNASAHNVSFAPCNGVERKVEKVSSLFCN